MFRSHNSRDTDDVASKLQQRVDEYYRVIRDRRNDVDAVLRALAPDVRDRYTQKFTDSYISPIKELIADCRIVADYKRDEENYNNAKKRLGL